LSGSNQVSENSLELRLQIIKENKHKEAQTERNNLIHDYMPFIIRVIANQVNRYIEVENSDEFSIGLIAFDEAIEKYDSSRGNFLSFAELVIRNRIKDYCRKKRKEDREVFLEDCLQNSAGNFPEAEVQIDEESIYLQEELQRYQAELAKFQITFEDLVRESPKHRDTRDNAVRLSRQISADKPLVEEIYAKRRLPVTKIIFKYQTTLKIIKRSRKFIISMVVIFTGGFSQLKLWVKNSFAGEKNV
jgi:RNA polymerase sigma factor